MDSSQLFVHVTNLHLSNLVRPIPLEQTPPLQTRQQSTRTAGVAHPGQLSRLRGQLHRYSLIPTIFSLVKNRPNFPVIFNNITKIYDSYPDLFKFWYGPTLIYGVSKPEYLEKVLTSPKALSKMYLYRYAVPLGGHGLFTAPGIQKQLVIWGEWYLRD
jgi:hypothetical protein